MQGMGIDFGGQPLGLKIFQICQGLRTETWPSVSSTGRISYMRSGGNDGKGAAWFARGAGGDLDVSAEGGGEFHEASDAEVAGAIARERGNLRLLDAEDFGELDLGLFRG